MFHLNAWIFSYQQCKTSGISVNMHALENAKITKQKKYARAGLQCSAAAQKRMRPKWRLGFEPQTPWLDSGCASHSASYVLMMQREISRE